MKDTLCPVNVSTVERVPTLRRWKMYLKSICVTLKVSFVGRCPLFRVSFNRHSIVCIHVYMCTYVHVHVSL